MAFEVCKESQYPDEVKTIIDKHKEEKFRFVYENSAHTYLLAGYGKQEKEEYVVAVRELFEKEEAVVLDTMLIHSSKKGERQTGEEGACPYIVIRCDKTDKPVLFQ